MTQIPAKGSKLKTATIKRPAITTVPETVPATVVAGFTGLTPARVAQMVGEGKIPTPGKKGAFNFRASVLAICEDLRGRNAARPGAAAEARTKEAQATTAELDAAERLGDLILKTGAKALWADATIEVRRMIEEAEFLNKGQVAKLLDRLGKIALAEDDKK